jgi:hypothetical protein
MIAASVPLLCIAPANASVTTAAIAGSSPLVSSLISMAGDDTQSECLQWVVS